MVVVSGDCVDRVEERVGVVVYVGVRIGSVD